MTVALQVCGIVGLVFLALLFLFAFLDAHGWFVPTCKPSMPVPYLVRLSTLRTEMNYWGANTLMELREAIVLNLNRQVEFVDDAIRLYSDDPEFDPLLKQVARLQGIDESIVREFLKEVGR